MKKKIAIIFTGAMFLGGIEISLLGLLDSVDYDKYDVDLFLYGHHGPLFSVINKQCNILPQVKELSYLREGLITNLRNGCLISMLCILEYKIKKQNFDSMLKKVVQKTVPQLKKEYDIAIGFFRPFDVLIEKVNAKVKIGWVHTDYSKAGEDLNILHNDFEKVDYIAGVSVSCCQSFIKLFPDLAEKVITIENCLSKNYVLKNLCCEVTDMPKNENGFTLLSVGRFCVAKNFDNVPFICKKLIEKGLNVKWYIIGFGSDEDLIRQKIKEAEMEDHVVILGKKENPYPYIKACDLYVQPSRYEGKCVSVREAQMLCKPVVITNYATSASQLEDGVDGIIVPMDNDGCADAIADVLSKPELMHMLSDNCKKRDYSNSQEVEKIYKLIEE